MMKFLLKLTIPFLMLAAILLPNSVFACTGSTLAGNLTPTDSWQTMGGVQAGDRFTFTIGAGEVIIFSFCQGGASYTNDPRIDIHDIGGTITYDFNDDMCGYGAELVWVCPASGTYSVGFYDFFCLTNGAALGTVAYKKLPTPTEQDCLGALPLCTSLTNHPQSYVGTGHYYDIFNFNVQQGMAVSTDNCPNCLVSGELNNVWYTFTAQTSGNLAFTIDPVTNTDDYDWALYSLNGGVTCFDLIDFSGHPPVSCNFAYVTSSNGNTGVGSGTSTCVGPVEDVGYNSTFAVTAGQTYVLTVSNFSSTQDGYSINFGASTATIVDNTGPALESLVYQPYCGSSSLTVQFSESVWCQSVQPSDFVLTGPNGTYSILDTQSIVCMSASSNTYVGTWYDDIWTLELGDLLAQSGTYTLSLNAGSVDDKCSNVNAQNQLVFNVVGITADLNTLSLCGCGGQSNGSLSVTNITGGTAPYTISWSGPSSFTSSLATITNLAVGTYTVSITDSEGICEFIESVDLTGAPPINPTATNNGPLCQGSTLNLTGGCDDPGSSYSWSGPGGFLSNSQSPSRANATVGMSGTYSLTVTDTYSCTASTSTDAVVYSVTPVTVTSGSPYCAGEDIQLNATTVVGASYAWSGPNLYSSAVEDPTITSCTTIQGGTYTVVVTDANSCTATANTNVVVSPGIAANLISINPLCYQGNTGQITVNVTAGTPNYTYAWSNGSTSNPATGLAAGTSICVTITDASTCTISLCKTLVDPADLVVTTTSVPTQCGFLDGEINVNAVGGAGGYTYSWSEGGFLTANITGLHPGDYTVTVRDVNNCSEIVTETVGFFGAGTVSITQLQDILCYGETTAVMTSQMSDGTLPFTYAWSVAGQNSANLSGQGAGSYSVSISDVYGCSGTATQIVTQPLQIDVSISSVDILCRGESDGSATVNVAGGIYPYVYAWDNGSTSSHISSLSAGTYSVTVKDINNCTMSEFVVINQPDKAVNINLVTSDVTCAGRYDGMALAQGDGGTAPYTVYWFQFGQLISSSIQVNSLSAGDFTVELFDVNNCAAEASFKIIEPSELIIGTEMSGVTCKGFNDGLIAVSAEGGTFPYSVAWSNGDTTFVASELLGGQYFVTVSDANGCLKGLGILLPENPILCLDIPNAFTPNADGVNDTWQIQYIEQYPAASVNIFNRWGQHIYQGSRDSEFWDGKFQDKFVPSGPYQYIIDLRNGMDPFTGVVVVVY